MWQLRGWRARHPEVIITGGSDGAIMLISIALGLFLGCIMGAVLLHLSLNFTPSKRNKAALQGWSRFGVPTTIILFLVTVSAMFILYLATFELIYGVAPRLGQAVWHNNVCAGVQLLMFFVALLVALWACIRSIWALRRARRQAEKMAAAEHD